MTDTVYTSRAEAWARPQAWANSEPKRLYVVRLERLTLCCAVYAESALEAGRKANQHYLINPPWQYIDTNDFPEIELVFYADGISQAWLA
jgi:hypothetical protein